MHIACVLPLKLESKSTSGSEVKTCHSYTSQTLFVIIYGNLFQFISSAVSQHVLLGQELHVTSQHRENKANLYAKKGKRNNWVVEAYEHHRRMLNVERMFVDVVDTLPSRVS